MFARVFEYVPPFISQILDFIYWAVLIFILVCFEWRDTENQQLEETYWILLVKNCLLVKYVPGLIFLISISIEYSEREWGL